MNIEYRINELFTLVDTLEKEILKTCEEIHSPDYPQTYVGRKMTMDNMESLKDFIILVVYKNVHATPSEIERAQKAGERYLSITQKELENEP